MAPPNKKRKVEEPQRQEAQTKLAAYGEAFMRMFDDYDEEQEAAAQAARAVSRPSDSEQAISSEEEEEDAAVASPSDAEMEELVTSLSGRKAGSMGASTSAAAGGGVRGRPKLVTAPRTLSAEQLRLERKKFMSSKAGDIFADVAGQGSQQRRPGAAGRVAGEDDEGGEDDDRVTEEELAKLRREVALYGSQALEKKERRALQQQYLATLGARPDKGHRIPARAGKPLAAQRAKKEAAAREEGVATGMVRVKGTGIKKKRAKGKARDPGLQEAAGVYRNGVLRLNKKLLPSNRSMGGGGKKGKAAPLPRF